MALIWETENFTVESYETPHVDRNEGGNLRIIPKEKYLDRAELPPKVAIEFMRLTMVVGEAYVVAMKNRGIELMRINYQDMGNWAFKSGKTPFFHLHIYGRAKSSVIQPYQEAVQLPDRSTGFYDNFQPLNKEDEEEIKKQIENVLKKEKYNIENWRLGE